MHTVGAREGCSEGDDGEETTEGHVDTGEEGECSELSRPSWRHLIYCFHTAFCKICRELLRAMCPVPGSGIMAEFVHEPIAVRGFGRHASPAGV